MIEIKQQADGSDLYIDGNRIDAEVTGFSEGSPFISIRELETARLFLSHKLCEIFSLGEDVWLGDFPGVLPWWPGTCVIGIQRRSEDEYALDFILEGSVARWNRPWTFPEYAKELPRTLSKGSEPRIMKFVAQDEVLKERLIDLRCLAHPDCILHDEIARCSGIIRSVHDLTEKSLAAKLRPESVVLFFDFPVEIAVACEQYLLYFTEFLRDLGVEATGEIKDESGQVLFAVTPTTAKDALDKIRLALEVYLSLPASPVDSSIAFPSEIEVQRLSAQIQYLNSQLTLASAVMQAKDAAIEAQRTTIGVLTGEVVVNSLKLSNAPVKNEEPLLDGMVSITKYEGKGFKVDLPEIFRRLRARFREP